MSLRKCGGVWRLFGVFENERMVRANVYPGECDDDDDDDE